MKVRIEKSFEKDLRKINDRKILQAVFNLIENLKSKSFSEVPNVKKLAGSKSFYRIRIGDFRIGLELKGEEVELIRILNRKDIYKYFP